MASDSNITRVETAARAKVIRVESYQVDLDLRPGATFATTTTVRFDCLQPGASSWLDLIAAEVHSISLNGVELDPAQHYTDNRVALPDLLEHNEAVVVASGVYMRTGEGMHRFVDPVDDETYIYTQFESSDARRVFANFEQPDLKASFEFRVTAPSHWSVISNSPAPEPERVDSERSTWRFAPTPRISTYITAIVAGPYHAEFDEYVGPHGTYPLSVRCRRSLAQYLDAEQIFLVTKQGMAYFEERFGLPYPFVKYDQTFCPEFNAGAMENAGCVTHHESYLFRSRVTDLAYEQRTNTVLHELAHMWFGDLVTMQWWDDIWLNESFAEWASHDASVQATRFAEAWTTFLGLRKAWAYRQDQLPSTHPIYTQMPDTESIAVNFDGITYAKGASALRQLVAWVGPEAFTTGLRSYFAKHKWGNTVLSDLLDELSAASGRDLTAWAKDWLTTAGVNLLRPVVECDADGTILRLTIVQEPPSAPPGLPPVLRPHRVAVGCYDHTDGGLVRTRRVELDVIGAETEVPELVGTRRPALLLLNDDDLTYAKIRLDRGSLDAAVESIGELRELMPRALIWAAAWDMTRDAEVPAGRFVDLVIAGLADEREITIVQTLLGQVKLTVDSFAAPEHRPAYLARLGAFLRGLLEDVEPGSDLQLAYVRALATLAVTDADLDLLAGLHDGTTSLPGLAVDTELRWALLYRLCVTGRAGRADIDAEVARDDTAAGQRYAMQCRAALPDPEAKAQAWKDAVAGHELTNSLLLATVTGFMQRDQPELVRPYLERYFVEVPQTWGSRTFEMGSTLAAGMFPSVLVDQHTLDVADATLAREDLPDSLHRLILEGRDSVARALRARAADA